MNRCSVPSKSLIQLSYEIFKKRKKKKETFTDSIVGFSDSLGLVHQTQPHFKGLIIVCMCIQCEVDTRQMLKC